MMILTGIVRLGRDAEVRFMGDKPVVNLALAYNYGKKDGDGKRPTQWIYASLWGDRAEKLAPFLTKGTQVSVVLEDVHLAEWEKKGGNKGYSLRARVLALDFASKPERREEPAKPATPKAKTVSLADIDDDLPF